MTGNARLSSTQLQPVVTGNASTAVTASAAAHHEVTNRATAAADAEAVVKATATVSA